MQDKQELKIKELERRLDEQERIIRHLNQELQYILREKERMKNNIERIAQHIQRS